MYIMCVILCLFSPFSRRVGALQISIIITIIIIIDQPFSWVAADIIGPITPASEDGNGYILTMIDYGIRSTGSHGSEDNENYDMPLGRSPSGDVIQARYSNGSPY